MTFQSISKYEQDFFNVKQGNQDIREYLLTSRAKAHKANIPDDQMVRIIANGLNSDIRTFVLQQDPTTFDELSKQATKMSNILPQSSSESKILGILEDLTVKVNTISCHVCMFVTCLIRIQQVL